MDIHANRLWSRDKIFGMGKLSIFTHYGDSYGYPLMENRTWIPIANMDIHKSHDVYKWIFTWVLQPGEGEDPRTPKRTS